MIETIKVSSRGQVVIPERMREKLDIKEGTKLVVLEKDKKLVLEVEKEFLEEIKDIDKEKMGWLSLAERSLKDIWDNEKDDKEWSKYL